MHIAFVLINLALLPIFISILKQFPIWVSFAFLSIVILESVFVAFFTLINFGGAFGPGILLFCVSAIFLPIVFLVWIVLAARTLPGLNLQQRVVYVIGGIIILFAQGSPVVGELGIGSYCDDKKIEYGNTLITKVREYHKDNGHYPSKIEDMIPAYLPDNPTYNCMSFLGLDHDAFVAQYKIMECEENPSLVMHSTDNANDIWYDFDTVEWSSVSFLDSDCY